jgi:hypothetical protein
MANEFKIKNGLVVSGSADFEQDLTVRGTITADQLIISIVSSSVLFESGSTQFGNSIEDTHKITGSLLMTGSIDLNGQPVETGRLAESTFSTYSGATNTRITNLETSTGSINGYTSSTNLRLTSIETSTGSLNTYSASNTTNIDAIHTSTGSLNTYTSSNTTNINAIHTSTGSLNSYTSSNTTNINAIHTSTASLNSFTSSAGGRLDSIEGISGSIASLNTYTGSNNTVIGTLQTATSSINSFTSSASSRLTSIEGVTGSIASLNTYTGSNNTVIGTLQTASSSLNSYTSSNTTNVNAIHTSTASLNSYTSSNTTNINAIHTATGSLNSYTSSNDGKINAIHTSTASLNTYTSSNTTNINAIHTATSSLNSFTSSINTTIKNKLNSDSVISSSIQVVASLPTGTVSGSSQVLNGSGVWSGSVQLPAGTVSGSSQVLNGSGVWSGSAQLPSGIVSSSSQVTNYGFATTGSNTFKSNQTISGSVIITENLTVFGSSSITYVTSSQLRVEDNIITVNTASPGSRFGGLEVHDSGSVGIATGSLLWDSVNNRWVYQNSSEASYGGGVLLSGPRSSGSLGSELTLTSGRVAKSAGGDHLNDSNITDNGTLVSINSNTEITGTFTVGGGGKIVAATVGGDEGGEILLGKAVTNTTLNGSGVNIDVYQNKLRIWEDGSPNRGAYLDISTLGSGVSTNLLGTVATASYVEYSNVANKPALVSGSSQITFLSISSIPSGLVSGSSQVLNGSGVWSGSAQLPSGVVSGSSQITFLSISSIPSGLVSGSSQVLAGTGIWSGSAQLPSGVVSGSSQVLNGSGVWSGSAQLPSGVVSGSSQITYGSISSIPSGIVSGSSQISFGSITGLPSGLVSGSSQITYGSLSGIPSGIVSGSSQISFGSITGVPSGLVSGSSQITLSSTTGFGSYLNQAVLTSSSPTFDQVITSNNGNGTNFRLGDDAWMGDINLANTFRIQGVQNAANAYIVFGNGDTTALGRASTGALTYGGNTVYHAGNLTNLNQLTNGPGYITSSSNITGTASNITAYTINQSVGTGNSPSFASVSAPQIAATSTADATGLSLRSTSEVLSGEGWATALYCYNNNDGFLVLGRDAATTARPVFHVGGYNNAGYAGYSDGDAMITLVRMDGTKNTGSTYAGRGLSNSSYYSNVIKTTTKTVFKDSQNLFEFVGTVQPSANNTYNLGSTTLGWANVYTNDLHLSNMNKPEGNDIDGTSGNWTIQEGAENLYIINNNNGKKFKISLEEIK